MSLMETIAVGFWGAYFGTVGLMLAASLAAYARSRQRVALTAALSSLISALFVVAYLGWLPIVDPGAEARLLAHVAALCAAALGLMLLTMLGLMREAATARRIRARLLGLAGAVVAVGWLLDPFASLALGSVMAFGVGAAAMAICVRSAWRGDRLAWTAFSGVSTMLVAVAGLSWIALDRASVPWWMHATSAVAGMAYLAPWHRRCGHVIPI